MRIISIKIEEFGPLYNASFEFDEGMNVIKGDNESGKSSLMLFIKYALYGFSKKARGTSVGEADRAIGRRTGIAGGSMLISHNGKKYLIERRAHRTAKSVTDKLQVTDDETKLVCEDITSPGEYFLGIPQEVFENSCSVAQLACASLDGAQVGTAIRNLLTSADESVDSKKALRTLEALRIKLLHKDGKGGIIYNLKQSKDELERRYTSAIEDSVNTDALKSELDRLDSLINEVSEKRRIADELYSKINLRSAIRLFDKLHEYELDSQRASEQLEKIRNEINKNGYLPDRQYLSSLTAAQRELMISGSEVKEAEDELERIRSASQLDQVSLDKLKKVEMAGGKEALCKRFSALLSKKKRAGTLGIILTLIGAASLSAAVLGVLNILSIPFSLIIGAVAVCLLIVSIILLSRRGNAKKKLELLCRELGIEANCFSQFIEDYGKLCEREMSSRERIEAKKTELSVKRRIFDTAHKSAENTLKKYTGNTETDTLYKENSSLTRAILEIGEYLDESEKLGATISALKTQIGEISGELSSYNEHQIRRRVPEDILSMSDEDVKKAKTEKSYHEHQLKALTDRRLNIERSLLERKYVTDDPFELSAKYSEVSGALEVAEDKYESLKLAIDTINTASGEMRGSVTPKLRALSSNYISLATNERYDTVALDDSLQISMTDKSDGFSYPIEAFSTGTKDIAYLSLRLSLLGILPSDELPPILLDETLVMLDNKRAAALLSLLYEHSKLGGQCILFSCQDREIRLCKESGIDAQTIEM